MLVPISRRPAVFFLGSSKISFTALRCFGLTSTRNGRIIPDNLKNKNKNSQEWLTRHINDEFVKKARYDNYRARSAYKLIDMNSRFNFIKPGMVVLDCGAAPGSWSQVLVRQTNADRADKSKPFGHVIAVDKAPFEPVPHAHCVGHFDLLSPDNSSSLSEIVKSVAKQDLCDVIVSDMAPSATGVRIIDHSRIIALCYAVFAFSLKHLRPGGSFVCKMWIGAETKRLTDDVGGFFEHTKLLKPDASREDSAELFLLARNFTGVQS